MRRPFLPLIVATVVLAASVGHAQTARQEEGRRFGLGLGLGSGSMSVGSETNRAFEASILARIGIDSRNRFLAMAELNPLGVGNPVGDESFRALNVLVGFNIGHRFKVRPCLGWQFRFWSGTQRVESSDSAPLFGVDIGPELQVNPGLTLSPEAVFRYSPIEIEGNVRGGPSWATSAGEGSRAAARGRRSRGTDGHLGRGWRTRRRTACGAVRGPGCGH